MTVADVRVAYPGHVVASEHIATLSEDAWRAHVALCGELDMADVSRLLAVLDGHLDAGRRVLRLDVHDVTFLDSSILGAIVGAHRRCADLHASLILTGVHGVVKRVINLTGLDQVLLIDGAGEEL